MSLSALPRRIDIAGLGETSALVYPAAEPIGACLALAHGAGAGQHHSFMTSIAASLAERGIRVVTFDFLYMDRRRRTPDRPPVLESTWRAVIDHVLASNLGHDSRLFIGGKSMGGRIASQVLASTDVPAGHVAGLVLLGYPLHPPGRPDKPRVGHLSNVRTPTFIVQGTRDDFGSPDEVRAAFARSPALVDWLIIEGGDHSFGTPRAAGRTRDEVLTRVATGVAEWILRRNGGQGV